MGQGRPATQRLAQLLGYSHSLPSGRSEMLIPRLRVTYPGTVVLTGCGSRSGWLSAGPPTGRYMTRADVRRADARPAWRELSVYWGSRHNHWSQMHRGKASQDSDPANINKGASVTASPVHTMASAPDRSKSRCRRRIHDHELYQQHHEDPSGGFVSGTGLAEFGRRTGMGCTLRTTE